MCSWTSGLCIMTMHSSFGKASFDHKTNSGVQISNELAWFALLILFHAPQNENLIERIPFWISRRYPGKYEESTWRIFTKRYPTVLPKSAEKMERMYKVRRLISKCSHGLQKLMALDCSQNHSNYLTAKPCVWGVILCNVSITHLDPRKHNIQCLRGANRRQERISTNKTDEVISSNYI
jgi:hypothetical protein